MLLKNQAVMSNVPKNRTKLGSDFVLSEINVHQPKLISVCPVCFLLDFSFLNSATVNAMERTEIKINLISEQLGLSWAG